MNRRYSAEQITRWIAETEKLVGDAETLVLAENGSRASRSALGIARFLREAVLDRAIETARANGAVS